MSFKFIKTAIATQCKLNLALKFSFFIKVGAVFLKQGLFLFTWSFFFNKYLNIQGWGFSELLALYGIVSFGVGFTEMFFYGLRELPLLVESSQLDMYLTQPKNILLNVALSKGDFVAFSEILYGLMLLSLSGYLFTDPLAICLLLSLSALFIFSLYLYLSSVSFFMKNASSFVRELYQNANILATQPNSAYRGFLKAITLTFLPVSYLSFFPIEYLRTHLYAHFVTASLGIVFFFLAACYFFYFGISRYESGNSFSLKH